jgi:hypothetical protein
MSRRPLDLRSLFQSWLTQGQGRKPITAATDLSVIRQFSYIAAVTIPVGSFRIGNGFRHAWGHSSFRTFFRIFRFGPSCGKLHADRDPASSFWGSVCSGSFFTASGCVSERLLGSRLAIWISGGACFGSLKAKAALA